MSRRSSVASRQRTTKSLAEESADTSGVQYDEGDRHGGEETPRQQLTAKTVETLKHDADKRKNIPTAEYQSVVKQEQQKPDPRRLRAPQPRSRPAARLARQGRAGLERPRRPRPAALHPGESPSQGADRRSAEAVAAAGKAGQVASRSTCSPTSTAFPKGADKTDSTSTTRTGPTA